MKTALITGGNSGIGRETALALARQGWQVLMAARDAEKNAAAVRDIQREVPGAKIDALRIDLTDFDAIPGFAQAVAERLPRIDALVLNAGLYTQSLSTNKHGYETMFAATHLGHFLLTHYLLDRVVVAQGRIVVSSSVAQWVGAGMPLRSVRQPSRHRFLQIQPFRAYGYSKLCNMLFVRELARRLKNTPVLVNGFHPGGIQSAFWRDMPGWVTTILNPALVSAAIGAKTQIYLASSPELKISGEYWAGRKIRRGSPQNRNALLATQLWDYSEKVFGIKQYGVVLDAEKSSRQSA